MIRLKAHLVSWLPHRLLPGRHRCQECWRVATVFCEGIDPSTHQRCQLPLCREHHFVDARGRSYCFTHWVTLDPDAPLRHHEPTTQPIEGVPALGRDDEEETI